MPRGTEESGLTALRVLLVADLVTRVAELGNLQVLTVLVTPGELPGHGSALGAAADALGIRPPAGHASAGEAPALLGGRVDVHVVSGDADVDDGERAVITCVGDAHMRGPDAHGQGTAELAILNKHDPLAVRLALMSFPSHQPADLTGSVVSGARETAGEWRRRVATWAEQPSRPVPAHLAETARAAFDDLDIPSAIALLHDLAGDDRLAAGARFETFLYVDRVLGLDLPREIGKLG